MNTFTWNVTKLLLTAASPIQKLVNDIPSNTHIFLNHQAIKILANDGYCSIARYLNKHIEKINQGVIWADKNWKNVAHYFNPQKNRGIWPWPDARDECRIYFSQSLKYWQQGLLEKCMFYLGAAVHIVQDMSNPFHARSMPFCGHTGYERWVQCHCHEYAVNDGGFYQAAKSPQEWVESNAKTSWRYYPDVCNQHSAEQYHKVTAILLPKAQRSTAGFFHWFIERAAR